MSVSPRTQAAAKEGTLGISNDCRVGMNNRRQGKQPKSQLGGGEFVTPGKALTRGQVCLPGLAKAHRTCLKKVGYRETRGDPPKHGRTGNEE